MTQEQRQPSPELLSLIKAAATNLLGFGELWASIKKKGNDEGFSEKELQDMLRPYLKEKLDSKKVWYLFHAEEQKDRSKQQYQNRTNISTNDVKKELEQKTIPIKPLEETPKIPPPPPEEDPKDTEIAYWKEKAIELEDALHKVSDKQFVPATQLQEQLPATANPTPELQMTDDLVFQYLRDRAKETGNILIIDRVGAGALVQALAQYKNSFGVAELFLRVIK